MDALSQSHGRCGSDRPPHQREARCLSVPLLCKGGRGGRDFSSTGKQQPRERVATVEREKRGKARGRLPFVERYGRPDERES